MRCLHIHVECLHVFQLYFVVQSTVNFIAVPIQRQALYFVALEVVQELESMVEILDGLSQTVGIHAAEQVDVGLLFVKLGVQAE